VEKRRQWFPCGDQRIVRGVLQAREDRKGKEISIKVQGKKTRLEKKIYGNMTDQRVHLNARKKKGDAAWTNEQSRIVGTNHMTISKRGNQRGEGGPRRIEIRGNVVDGARALDPIVRGKKAGGAKSGRGSSK